VSLYVVRVYPTGGESGGHLAPEDLAHVDRIVQAATEVVEAISAAHVAVTVVVEVDR
jgi:hypothetical protein